MTSFELATLAAFVLSQAADVVTTRAFLRRGGRESNPVIRRLMAHLGTAWVLVKAVVACGSAVVLWVSAGPAFVWLPTALMMFIAWRNTRVAR